MRSSQHNKVTTFLIRFDVKLPAVAVKFIQRIWNVRSHSSCFSFFIPIASYLIHVINFTLLISSALNLQILSTYRFFSSSCIYNNQLIDEHFITHLLSIQSRNLFIFSVSLQVVVNEVIHKFVFALHLRTPMENRSWACTHASIVKKDE